MENPLSSHCIPHMVLWIGLFVVIVGIRRLKRHGGGGEGMAQNATLYILKSKLPLVGYNMNNNFIISINCLFSPASKIGGVY